VATPSFPLPPSYKRIGNVNIGGWFLVSAFAFHAALELEASISGPRAVFAFDLLRLLPVGVCHASRDFYSISRDSRVSIRASALVHFFFIEVLYFRSSAPMHNFTCPLMQHENAFQYYCAIETRCQFYARVGFVDAVPNCIHMTTGSDHYWNISRRMREDLSQRTIVL